MKTGGGKTTVFITVGSTKFETLVSEATKKETLALFNKLGYERITIQYGGGTKPTIKHPGLTCFAFKDNIETEMQGASLIICHAGAGSVLEAVRIRGAKVIVCTNDTLLDGHQLELADKMDDQGHVIKCTPEGLKEAVERAKDEVMIPFPVHETHKFPEMLNNILGWK